MIKFDKFSLDNGLRVIVHQDSSTPIVAINIIYDVGSRDENPDKTGFAHLFEHLMFGGSVNIPKYDEPLQNVGGENNAFTNNDITNYYLTLPKQNIEIAFWLESDRMLDLAFSKKSLDVQRNVVSEEFRQNYLNQPYGDAWLMLKPLAYKVHPYRWPTIGKEISHIENAEMEDVRAFYKKYYNPNNAVLVVGGDVDLENIKHLAEKWFAPIPGGESFVRNLPKEPIQTKERKLKVERDVPTNVIHKAYHMSGRLDLDYYSSDLLSDILSNGDSSRLYQKLVKDQKLFIEINAFLTGDFDEGLFVIIGKIANGINVKVAEDAIINELEIICKEAIDEDELNKVKIKAESSLIFSEVNILNKTMNLAYFEILGDANLINLEIEKYKIISVDQIQKMANTIFREENCSTLYYLSKQE
ncbi:MAG: peptidase M16 [Bacteroidetes bacterium HGW-Bacteroidetes-17]|jgi:predicted Zn-dependent peptidase|nr:MAG: peptidase M16 [Bacteroidetes bacterium HGW-Bacteroidetes-17]